MTGYIPRGKSIFVWDLARIKSRYGSFENAIQSLLDAGVTDVLIKLVEGRLLYNKDHAAEFIGLCKEAGIGVHGWSYNYGETNTWRENNDQTDIEAKLSAQMVLQHDLKSWVMNCEAQWKGADGQPPPFQDEALEVKGWYEYFWSREGIDVPIGFTSYALPHNHNLAWGEFLTNVDYWIPQVYWQGRDGLELVLDLLENSIGEYRAIGGDMPIIAAGTMYKESNYPVEGQTWWPSGSQVSFFCDEVVKMGLDGVTMWELAEHQPRPELWEAFAAFTWPEDGGVVIPEDPNYEMLLDLVMENSVRLTVIEAGIVALADMIKKAAVTPIPTLPPVNGSGDGEPVPPDDPPVILPETVLLHTKKEAAGRCYLSYSTGMNKGGSTGTPRMIMDFWPAGAQADDRLWWRNDKPILVHKGVIKTDGGHLYYKVVYDQQHRIPLYAGNGGQWPMKDGKPLDLYISNKYIM